MPPARGATICSHLGPSLIVPGLPLVTAVIPPVAEIGRGRSVGMALRYLLCPCAPDPGKSWAYDVRSRLLVISMGLDIAIEIRHVGPIEAQPNRTIASTFSWPASPLALPSPFDHLPRFKLESGPFGLPRMYPPMGLLPLLDVLVEALGYRAVIASKLPSLTQSPPERRNPRGLRRRTTPVGCTGYKRLASAMMTLSSRRSGGLSASTLPNPLVI